MKNITLEREHFGSGKRHYYIDFNRAWDESKYIKISRTDRLEDHSVTKSEVVIFEEDFYFLIEGLSMLFTSVKHRVDSGTKGSDGKAMKEMRIRGIKSWEPEARPREKSIAGGMSSLGDAEVLAMLIGSGTPTQTAVDLAASILKSCADDLERLSKMTLKQLCRFPGIGEAKASSILAAIDLSRRMQSVAKPAYQLKAM